MAKPIFLITIPDTVQPKEINGLRDKLTNQLYDYHILIFLSDLLKYEVLNAESLPEIELDRVEKLYFDAIKSLPK